MAEHGRLDLTPWARQALSETRRPFIAARVPAGHTLWISTANHRVFTARLTSPGGGLVAQAIGPLDTAIDAVLGPVAVPA